MNGVRSTYSGRAICSLPLPRLCCLRRLLGRRMRSSWRTVDVVITLEAPRSMAEGGDATITVRGKATVLPDDRMVVTRPATERSRSLFVVAGGRGRTRLPAPRMGEFGAAGQVNDAGIVSNPR